MPTNNRRQMVPVEEALVRKHGMQLETMLWKQSLGIVEEALVRKHGMQLIILLHSHPATFLLVRKHGMQLYFSCSFVLGLKG